jgi:protein-S-isoprenylcysteine O-methyltransferase Ste14
MAIALLGAAVFLGTLSPFIFPLLFMAIIDRLVIPLEEHVLEKKFGRE